MKFIFYESDNREKGWELFYTIKKLILYCRSFLNNLLYILNIVKVKITTINLIGRNPIKNKNCRICCINIDATTDSHKLNRYIMVLSLTSITPLVCNINVYINFMLDEDAKLSFLIKKTV